MMDSSQEPAMLVNAALHYARRRWRVLPVHGIHGGRCTCGRADCESPGKHPRLRDWPRLATIDADRIGRWWSWWPNANVGIATGNGVLVLDVDGDAGVESLAELERQHGQLFDTPRALTGGGGSHYLFTVENTIANKVQIASGLDVRGDNGQIVAPPSLHVSGRRYVWDLTAHPDEVPVAPAPRWLLELISTAFRRMPTATGEELRLERGTRNDRLFRLACGWRRQGLGHKAIRAMLEVVDREHCVPALADRRELDDIADSATKYPPGGDIADEALLAAALRVAP
jgi:putative DNA primase/helicase